MKKLFVLAAALLTVGVASAQITYSIGYINTSLKSEVTYMGVKATNNSTMNGFTISVDDNINLTGNLNVAPGAGMALSFHKEGGATTKKFSLYVPVDFNYGFALNSDLKLFVYAGPTVDFGILYNTKNGDNKYNFYNKDEGNLSRFDLLLGGGAWLTYKDQLRFKVGYKAGLLNTNKTDNCSLKNNVLSVSVGYVF